MTKYIPLLACGFLLASCHQQKEQQAPAAPSFPVIEIPSRDVTGESAYPVSIEGIINNEVRAKISGYITNVLVDEGQHVKKGQLLFRLETQSLSEDAQAAKANIEAAQVGVTQLEHLVKQNIVSQVQLETAKARLAQAKATYESIQANINYANIRSPIDGYVGKIPYRMGNLVDPSSPQPLTTVSHTDQVYAYFSMNESEYLDFLQHTPGKTLSSKMEHFPEVQLQLSNGDIYLHKGKITTVTAQVDPATGTVSFRATFPNPEHLLANGSSGTILIPKSYQNVAVVPQQSTFESQGKVYVYRLLKDSTVTPGIIEVAGEVGNLYVIHSGLQAGDKIVAQGAGQLHDQEKIIPLPVSFDSLANGIKPVFQ